MPADRVYRDRAGFRTLDSVLRAREIFGQAIWPEQKNAPYSTSIVRAFATTSGGILPTPRASACNSSPGI